MNGTSRLLVYQLLVDGVAGDRSQAWRLLDVGKIDACKVLEETFDSTAAVAIPVRSTCDGMRCSHGVEL